eukprot:CAMPEP_0114690616 /NCGR_PEP_ID=MMETSP0191-20121206/65910_1 /TAXON_ID=126664 /ORGANISM="Sorites sp." /LENGTH=73 /DNA_ID=CAMNT_0001980785 /DNA_START=52 /DNA_END=273 /DNA_ORIENTATION=-
MTDVKPKDLLSKNDDKMELMDDNDSKMESNETSVALQDKTNTIKNDRNEESTPIAKGRAKRNRKEVNYRTCKT